MEAEEERDAAEEEVREGARAGDDEGAPCILSEMCNSLWLYLWMVVVIPNIPNCCPSLLPDSSNSLKAVA